MNFVGVKFTAFSVSTEYASLPLAMAVGAIVGALVSLIHAFSAVTLGVKQIVSGLALVAAGTGFSTFFGSLNRSALAFKLPILFARARIRRRCS